MRFVIYPYKMGSMSGRALAAGLHGHRVYPDRKYKRREGDVIINWGSSTVPNWDSEGIINPPEAVKLASNKIKCLERLTLRGVPCLEYTVDSEVARGWIRDGHIIFARHKLTGHSGEGLVVFPNKYETLKGAKLYTKGISSTGEYRVHVFQGEILDYRKKSRAYDSEPTEIEDRVRTNGNGWIFREHNLKRLKRIEKLAKDAVEALGLDFGAVDIIKDEDGNVFVCEVNTAMALETRTLERYLQAFKDLT